MKPIQRIHHISAIVGDPNENLRFYRDVLGLRLIKQTVNFDDPSVYHLYFADYDVTPGTIMTFFPWPNNNYGWKGSGQVGRIAFRIPKGSVEYWKEHLTAESLTFKQTNLFGNTTLEFQDIHQLDLALVEGDTEADTPAILGFHGSILLSANPKETNDLLTTQMGLTRVTVEGDYHHFETVGKEKHRILTPILPQPGGRFGIGTVHHIAWSVPDIKALEDWQTKLRGEGFGATMIKDRNYFESVYLKERGRVIFEFATDGPGFMIDETFDELGQTLQLPAQYEHMREEYTRLLPELDV